MEGGGGTFMTPLTKISASEGSQKEKISFHGIIKYLNVNLSFLPKYTFNSVRLPEKGMNKKNVNSKIQNVIQHFWI